MLALACNFCGYTAVHLCTLFTCFATPSVSAPSYQAVMLHICVPFLGQSYVNRVDPFYCFAQTLVDLSRERRILLSAQEAQAKSATVREQRHAKERKKCECYWPSWDFHQRIACDMCDRENFSGVRYLCANREDTDMCEQCEAENRFDPALVFIKVRRPIPLHSPLVQYLPLDIQLGGDNTESGFVCKSCGQHILGVRYKCINIDNYDLCEDCEASARYDPDLLFLKLNKSLLNAIPALPIAYPRGTVCTIIKHIINNNSTRAGGTDTTLNQSCSPSTNSTLSPSASS